MTKAEAIKKIMDKIDEYRFEYDFEYYGVRFQEAPMEEGEILDNSYVWVDGEWTDEELDGTCAVGLNDLDVLSDVDYPGEHIAVIGGDYMRYGEDLGEVIIREAEVVEVLC